MNPQSRALKIGLVTALLLATFVIGIIAFRPEPQQSQRSASPTTMTPTETLTAVNSSPDERLNPNGRTSSAAHDRADIGTTHAPAPPANTTAAATTTTATAQTAATPTYTPGYASSGNDNQITDEAVAAQHNLTVEQVRRLQKERALTNNSIATLTDAQLKRALSRLEQPKAQMLEDMLRQRAAQMKDENGDIPENALVRAVEQKAQMPVDPQVWGEDVKTNREGSGGNSDPLVAGIDRNSWTAIGPGNIGGRTRAIAINPTNANIIYLGSVGGGVWKTTNGGANWTPLNDFMANLAVTSLVIDPTNTSVIYAATGEGFNGTDAIRGAGIFKSVDAGATWTQLLGTANNGFYAVTRLAMNPNNSQVLLAATSKINGEGIAALWRSTNGGTSWAQVLSGGGFLFTDVDFHPTNGNFAIAGSAAEPGSGGLGIAFYSTNGGQTWAPSTGTYVGGRVEVTYAVANPARVYASIEQDSGALYYSNDGGQSFARINITGAPNYLGTQGWWDNVVWAGDPTNLNHVIVGGIDLYGATDATNFTKISSWQNSQQFGTSAHADHHAIVAHPQYNGTTNRTVFFGNDGGIYKTVDVFAAREDSGWTELNNNLAITQFFGAAGHAASGRIVGGTQDNGTLRFRPAVANPSENWNAPFGGDGGYSAYDPNDENFFYGEYVYLQIHRGTTADGFSASIYEGITEATAGSANFIAPFILDPNEPNRLLGGARSLWRSNNAKAATPTWAAIKPPIASNSNISAVAVKPGDSNQIWVGHNDGQVFSTTNGTAANPTWTPVTNFGRYVTRITPGNAGDNRVYVTLGGFSAGNVLVTNNNGASWTNAATGLPQAPVRSLVINPGNPDWLYIGTEVGVFASTNGGASWSTTNDGPSNVSVDELFWMGNKLVAATHGRGLFSITPTGTAPPSTVQFAATSQSVAEDINGGIAQVQVMRTGNTAQAATVGYITNDDQRLFNCNPQTAGVPGGAIAGVATSRCDYSSTVGTLSFAAGETSKTILVALSDDVHVEGAETFTISLRNPTNTSLAAATATITIQDNDAAGQANPISGNPFFVRQHYLDFFGRSPVQSEVDGWVRVTGADCSLDAPDNCYDRIWISGKGFFESTEFQQKGYFAYRFYKTLGASRLPTYNEFIPDMVSLLGTGDADKNAFTQRFIARSDYQAIYPASQTNDQFVDKLVQTTGLTTLNAAAMKASLNNSSKTRAQVLREVVESAEMNSREYTNAWVVMQYFGYLRRDGAPSEYQVWIDYLNQNPTKWRQMINGFVNSTEYRQRFGRP